MAVMARQLGIPSRVAVGFIPGSSDVPGRNIITTHDLHAWPELYFEGAGWVPFEPTPPARTGEPPAYTLGVRAQGDGTETTAPQAAQPSASPSAGSTFQGSAEQRDHDPDALRQNGAGQAGANSGFPWALTLGMLVVVAVCALPALARLTVHRRRWMRARTPETTALAAWGDLQDTLTDFGHGVPRAATPRQFVAHLAGNVLIDDQARAAAGRIAVAAERCEFARSVGDVDDLRADVSTVRDSLASSASRGERLRAAVLPRSTVRVVHRTGERVADALDWVDGTLNRGRNRLRRH
jgi:transglutaminase superfamily protein